MFRRSIISTGENFVRVSTRGLGKPRTVIQSSSGQSEGLGYHGVQAALKCPLQETLIEQKCEFALICAS
jgi:hypothetical protein